jgi:hypothetical protein
MVAHRKAVLAGLVPDLAVHVALLFPGLVEGGDLLVDEAAEAVAEGFVVGVNRVRSIMEFLDGLELI